ncbi:MAG: bifunctional diaminohydroxyphosphoribosylaminopyrimidine deaminase/5-amino-6-(5-phosphoribosylamino)uracil reductase RibD [Gammaproteobacteria bacterium]
MSRNDTDHAHMSRALQLAARGLYTTDPNPRVGCVIMRDGVIVGEGFHARAGEPHAEVHALRAAGDRAAGATVYVTLEPCSHHGRTPPCVEAVLAARPARVVIAMQDPNPKVAGSGIARLRAAGIAVDVGVLEAGARELNPGFIRRMETGRPFVRVKLAMSVDGRTAMASGESQWITGPAAREDVQRLRARSAAVLTGIGTLRADDPALTVRPADWKLGGYHHERGHDERAPVSAVDGQAGAVRQPLRVLLDRELAAPPVARLFAGEGPVLVVGDAALLATPEGTARAATLQARPGVEVIGLPATSGHLDLAAVLAELGRREVNELLVEAGPVLAGAFVAARLADELVIYQAPVLMGSAARPLVELPLAAMADKLPLVITDVRRIGPDIRMTARFPPAL